MREHITIIDFETTGFDAKEHRPVEIAARTYRVCPQRGGLESLDEPLASISTLLDPEQAIPPDARQIHHIGPGDVQGMPTWSQYRHQVEELAMQYGGAIAAHNCDFDKEFYGATGCKWICTRRIAYQLCTEAPSMANQYLRYYLEIEVDLGSLVPHRALADVMVTAAVLDRILRDAWPNESLDEDPVGWMIEHSDPHRHPFLLREMRMGKHKGTRMDQVPVDYLQWIAGQGEKFSDQDVAVSAHHALKGRYHPMIMKERGKTA